MMKKYLIAFLDELGQSEQYIKNGDLAYIYKVYIGQVKKMETCPEPPPP